MKQKQTIIMVVLAITLLALTACEGGANQELNTIGFIGGTKGVDLKFSTNEPPTSISDGGQDPFSIVVELINQGEHEIKKENVFVRLTGFSATEFGVTNEQLKKYPESDLIPRTKTTDGTIISAPTEYIVFENLNYQGYALANLEYPIRAEVCYNYETTAITNICIKEDFVTERATDLCKVSEIKKVSNSGGPVQVTNIKQAPSGRDRTTITFSLQNKDLGKVIRSGTECTRATQNDNRVFVSVTGLDPQDTITCRGLIEGGSASGYTTLTDDQPKEVVCTIEKINDRNPRLHQLQINVAYDYLSMIQQQLTVLHTPQ